MKENQFQSASSSGMCAGLGHVWINSGSTALQDGTPCSCGQAKWQTTTQWTNADIDAAYLMGMINAGVHPVDPGEPFPDLTRIQKELDRLQSLGFKRPYEALRQLRYNK